MIKVSLPFSGAFIAFLFACGLPVSLRSVVTSWAPETPRVAEHAGMGMPAGGLDLVACVPVGLTASFTEASTVPG